MTQSRSEASNDRLDSKTGSSNRRIPDWKAHLVFWTIAAIGFVLDLWTKSAVFAWLEQKPGNSVSIIDGFLRLVMTVNPGAAFGIIAGRVYLLVIVSIIALVIILIFFFLGGSKPILVHIALALFAAGICGNLYDRIFNDGLVRDFIDVVYWPGRHWPAFNVADSLLCIGIGLLMLSTFKSPKRT